MAIPASQLVQVNPGVIGASGANVALNGMVLTTSYRIPIGGAGTPTTIKFTKPDDVTAHFGNGSIESQIAAQYFVGFLSSTIKPGALYFAQYPWAAPVPAYLQGAATTLSLAQLQAVSGTLIITIDGVTFTSSTFNLGSAGSFSAAAATIQTALAAVEASVTGIVHPATGVTDSTTTIAGTTMTVNALTSGTVVPGGVVTGSGVTTGTTVVSQLTGTTGLAGTYQVSLAQTVSAAVLTITDNNVSILSVTAVGSGTVAVGQNVTGAGIPAGTIITSLYSGSGSTGLYLVTPGAIASTGSEAITLGTATVTFDSVSNAFLVTGGLAGAAATITTGTGTAAGALGLSSGAGAVTSQGSNPVQPMTFMNSLIARQTDWFTFFTAFDPGLNTQNLLAQWTSLQNTSYMYVMPDADPLLITSNYSASAWGVIQAAGYSGTLPIWNNPTTPVQPNAIYAAAASGFFAALNFNQLNGRQTLAYRQSPGLLQILSRGDWSSQLLSNGVNFYGVYSEQNNMFTWWQNGTVSGPFTWADTYAQAVYLARQLQLSLLALLGAVGNIPYNAQGDSLIEAACLGPINQMVNYGAIRPGVTLSPEQAAQVNNQAGKPIDATLFATGWYLQSLAASATAQVRAARTSPSITLFYVDGESVQQIDVSSLVIL